MKLFKSPLFLRFGRLFSRRKQRSLVAPVAGGVGLGALAGAAAGLLLAPKSGKELRKDIGDKASSAAGKASEAATKLKAQIARKSSTAESDTTPDSDITVTPATSVEGAASVEGATPVKGVATPPTDANGASSKRNGSSNKQKSMRPHSS